MDALRLPARHVEECDFAGLDRIRYVVDLESCRLESCLVHLVRHEQRIAAQRERIAAHVAMRQRKLPYKLRLARLGDVEYRKSDRRMLMRDVHDAPAVARQLHRHAFAEVRCATGIVTAEEFQIVRDTYFRHRRSPRGNRPRHESVPGRITPVACPRESAATVAEPTTC